MSISEYILFITGTTDQVKLNYSGNDVIRLSHVIPMSAENR